MSEILNIPIPINVQDGINVQGGIFSKMNKHADQNKAMQGDFFFSKLINVHARLFGTLEYIEDRKCFRIL